jgi:hypothetical protein
MAIHAPCGTERDGKTVREFAKPSVIDTCARYATTAIVTPLV